VTSSKVKSEYSVAACSVVLRVAGLSIWVGEVRAETRSRERLAAKPAPTGAGDGTSGTETIGVEVRGGVTDGIEASAAVTSCVDCLDEDGGGAW
jgi:hypothetical protein